MAIDTKNNSYPYTYQHTHTHTHTTALHTLWQFCIINIQNLYHKCHTDEKTQMANAFLSNKHTTNQIHRETLTQMFQWNIIPEEMDREQSQLTNREEHVCSDNNPWRCNTKTAKNGTYMNWQAGRQARTRAHTHRDTDKNGGKHSQSQMTECTQTCTRAHALNEGWLSNLF